MAFLIPSMVFFSANFGYDRKKNIGGDRKAKTFKEIREEYKRDTANIKKEYREQRERDKAEIKKERNERQSAYLADVDKRRKNNRPDLFDSTFMALFVGLPLMLLSLLIVIGIFWFVGSLAWSMIFG